MSRPPVFRLAHVCSVLALAAVPALAAAQTDAPVQAQPSATPPAASPPAAPAPVSPPAEPAVSPVSGSPAPPPPGSEASAAPPTASTSVVPAPVEVSTLSAPDAFSTAGRPTGLPADLWRGASVQTVSAVLPLLASKPLSPAAVALARRVLATGAPGPKGAGPDPSLTAARAQALTTLGDPRAAAAILARAPGMDRNAELSRAAAESALLAGDDARACAIEEGLTVGRDEIYWVRLRAYCQAVAGQKDAAQLTFELAQSQGKDAIYGRLMGAKLAGAGDPGAASLRNGLDYALSRNLGLDLTAAKASPEVAAALAGAGPAEPAWTIPPGDDPVLAAARTLAAGGTVPADLADGLEDAAEKAPVKARGRLEAAALLIAANLGAPGPEARGRLAALAGPLAKAPAGRVLALESAAGQKLMGETAMLALWICAGSGAEGPAAGDRALIIHALRAARLNADARNFAVEGLLALK